MTFGVASTMMVLTPRGTVQRLVVRSDSDPHPVRGASCLLAAGTVSRANGAANRIRVGQGIGQVQAASPARASRRVGLGRPSRPRCRGVGRGGR